LEEFMMQFRKRAAVVAAAASIGVAALPGAAHANATPTFANGTLTVSGDGASDTITLSAVAGQLALNGTAVAGANADGSVDLVVDGGDGRDVVDASALAAAQYKSLTVHGGAGDDVITGGAGNDHLLGDDGNDRVIGFRGADALEGGNGNDVLVWNNGDGSDVADGDAGADTVEVNGSQTGNDQFTVKPNGQRVQFDRISLNGAPAGNFGIDLTAEKVQVNGLGGDDEAIGSAGLAPLTSLELNGGPGADHLVGGDSADVINGGDDNDSLDGAGGNDRVAGDRGNDLMHGGEGDDVLVWNNGDGTDDNEGDAGIDTSEVNGAGQGDAFTITPNGAHARFDRTNLVPFGIDIATEDVQVNALGGDDTLSVAPGTGALLAVNANGGSGNDRLVGAEEPDSFFGGAGDDVLDGGLGADLLDGQDGNDTLQARDGAGDLVRGGPGFDAARTDAPGVDIVDGVESLDASAVAGAKAQALKIGRAKLVRRHGSLLARITVSCPTAAASACKATLSLTTANPLRLHGVKVVALLGTKKVTLNSGAKTTVSIKLAKGAARLAHGRKLAIRATAVTTTTAGKATATRALSLSLPKANA
jgi:Ca2+-binding RTX toxin-like protein